MALCRMRSVIASGFAGRASDSDATCFSSVDANAAGDESRRFLRRRLTKAVPKPLPLFAAGTVVIQLAMYLALFGRVGDFERLQGAPGIQGIAVRIDQIALQATD